MDQQATVATLTGLAGIAGLLMTAAWLDAMRRTARRDMQAIHAEIRRLAIRMDDRDGHALVTLPPPRLPISTLRLPTRVNGTHAP